MALLAVVLDGTQYQAYAKESVAAVAQTTNVESDTTANLKVYKASGTVTEKEYSSVEKGYVTPVENQKDTQLCWAYAFCAAMEISAKKQGLGTYNLSEYQVGYLTYAKEHLMDGGTDTIQLTGKNWSNAGGSTEYILSKLSQGYTIKEESGLNATSLTDVTYEKCLGDGVLSLGDAYRAYYYDLNNVKSAIKESGSVIAPMTIPLQCYDVQHASLCTDKIYRENGHEVTIVGWNDSFPKENFGKVKPEKDGAWLCKNSWGTLFGQNGYFWISYEDYGLKHCGNIFGVTATRPDTRMVYGYDGGYSHRCIPFYQDTVGCEFVADQDLAISGIKFAIMSSTDEVINVRILKNISKDHQYGDLIYNGFYQHKQKSGYLNFNFKNVYLTKGTKYFVVLNGASNLEIETQKAATGGINSNDITINSDFSGNSYIYADDKWIKANESVEANGNDICLRVCASPVTHDVAKKNESPVLNEYPGIKKIKKQKGSVVLSWEKSDTAKKYYYIVTAVDEGGYEYESDPKVIKY